MKLSELAAKYGTLVIGIAVVAVVLFMVIPLPPVLLDLLLAMNITLALIILLVAIHVMKPLDFSSFPTVLLITTLFRLSLNIASTRLILIGGNTGTDAAGKVIQVFGSFVVGGNYVVGIILFLILVLINFIVITKGSGRIAEVAARFTLDAMPGKQMAIDADLNAGLIDDNEARTRRSTIEREADFYGVMDGSAKFVRGDAIAGLVITAINIIAGFIIGVAQQGMGISEAAAAYTILTVGDGLVSQIPALVISTAAGVVVSRAASDKELGLELSTQLLQHKRALYIVAALLVGFGLLPGMPLFIFWFLGAGIAFMARYMDQAKQAEVKEKKEKKARDLVVEPTDQEKIEALLPVDLLELEVGYGLVSLVDAVQGGDLLERIGGLRRQFASTLGIVLPPVHVRDNLQLSSGRYAVKIKGVQVASGEVMPERLLAMNPGDAGDELPGIDTVEPAFGLPARWVTKADRDNAEAMGFTVVDASTVVATHLSEVLRAHAHVLLGREEFSSLLDVFKRDHAKVVDELIPDILPAGEVLKVLKAMLREGLSIRDLRTILETLADYGMQTKSPEALTELVRARLAPGITRHYMADDGSLHVSVLSRETEDAFRENIAAIDGELQLSVDPGTARRFIDDLKTTGEDLAARGTPLVLLVPPEIRRPVRALLERFAPDWAVVSHREVDPNVNVECDAEIVAVEPLPESLEMQQQLGVPAGHPTPSTAPA